MRYRALSDTDDYQFGHSQVNFYIDSPACVAQAIKTRLLLMKGEWFTDNTDGTDYATKITGKTNRAVADEEIRNRVLNTPGVQSIDGYFSSVANRNLTVTMTVTTDYGQITTTVIL